MKITSDMHLVQDSTLFVLLFLQSLFSITSNNGLYHVDSGAPTGQFAPPFPFTKNHSESSCTLPYTTHYRFLTLFLGIRSHFFAAVICCLNKDVFNHSLVQWSEQAS